MTIQQKVTKVKKILPKHYKVIGDPEDNSINCKSNIGISDAGVEKEWKDTFKKIKTSFNDFLEVFHSTCTNHSDFTIYFKQ